MTRERRFPSWNRRRQTVLLAAALTLILLGSLWFATDREPRHEGRSLSSWLEEINQARSVSNAVPALLAIRAIGTNALPFLCENVRLQNASRFDAGIFAGIVAAAQRFDFLAKRFTPRSSLYGPTCLAFRALGTNAAAIVGSLGDLLIQPRTSASAQLALYAIGPSAAPAFERGCDSAYLRIRTESALYLAKLPGKDLWTAWSTSPYGRLQLALSTAPNFDDLKTLVKHLKHPNAAVRRATAEALALQTGQARSVVDALLDAGAGDENLRHDDTGNMDDLDPFSLIPN